MPVTWSDEKLILLVLLIVLYCPGRGSNSRLPAHRGFKHGQGVLRLYPLGDRGLSPSISTIMHANVMGIDGSFNSVSF